MGNLQFSRPHRLNKKKEIDLLFTEGRAFNLGVIRVIYLADSGTKLGDQVLFSVPSKTFKRAVDRNLLKRRMRESYRKNRLQLNLPIKLNLAYIYIAKQALPYSEIEKKVIQSFQKLANEFKA